MKKLILAFLILFPLTSFASTYDDMAKELMQKIPAKDKSRVLAVMPFSSEKKFASDATIATEEMTKALINAGANVSERSQIDKLLREQELQQAGVLTNEDAGEIGQGLGAKYVILGSLSEINKFGEEGNIGLKINVKLVISANYKVLAAASGEALAGDASSRYKRKAPRKAAEYPQFLEVFAGANSFKYSGDYDGNDEEYDSTAGFSAGARFIHESKGFFTSGWEFVYSTRDYDKMITRFNSYKVSWFPMIRIPLWAYMPALPDYTSIHLGYSIGFGVNSVTYTAEAVEEDSNGFGICTSAIAGLRLGVSDSISFFGEFRYTPSAFNNYYRSHEASGSNIAVSEEETGPSVYFGISLAP
jgi:TolB-like protein